jgi:phage protein D
MKTVSRSSKLFVSAVAALLVLALGASAALGVTSTEQTRETYVAAVEPICKTNTKANERILSGAEKKVKEGKLKVAAGQFTQAAAAFSKAVKQIKAVPQPVADQAKLAKWTGYLEGETKLLSEIGKALKAGKKGLTQSLSVKLENNGRLANNSVLGFDFKYCLIDSSRFS